MKKASLWFVGIAVAWALSEFILVSTEISLPPKSVPDGLHGLRLRPGARVNVFAEGMYIGRVNEFGYLGPAYPRSRRHDAPRIALIGDSYVMGLYVLERQHFRSLLEADLRSRWQKPVEILNFGRTEMDFSQMFLQDIEFAAEFTPDLIIYVLKQDDFSKPSRLLGPRPVLLDGEVHVDRSFAASPEFLAARRLGPLRQFATVGLVGRALRRAQRGDNLRTLFGKLAGSPSHAGVEEIMEGSSIISDPDPGPSDLHRALLEVLCKRREQGGPKLLIAATGPLKETYLAWLSRMNVPVVDVDRAFDPMREAGRDPHWWSTTQTMGHWNIEAQAAVAAFLRDILDSRREELGLR